MFDAYTQMEDVDEFLHNLMSAAHLQRVGVMFVESFRMCSTTQSDCDKHCAHYRQGAVVMNFTGVWHPLAASGCDTCFYSRVHTGRSLGWFGVSAVRHLAGFVAVSTANCWSNMQ
jgi:hypothetical protein